MDTETQSLIRMFRQMFRIRTFEERVGELFLKGGTAGSMLHLSIGEESAAVGVGEAMNYWAKNLLAGDLLDWSPRIPIDEGLRLTINSVRATRVIN